MSVAEDFYEELYGLTIICTSHSREDYAHVAHSIVPERYLKYAKADIDQDNFNEPHRAVNSIANSKKAIDCRIEDILCYWGISSPDKKNSRLHFPAKVKILSSLGINTPLLINNINRYRNKVEHYFVEPSLKDAIDFYELAELYLGYTSRYIPELYEYNDRYEIGEYNSVGEGIREESWYNFALNRGAAELEITLHTPGRPEAKISEIVSYKDNNQLFCKLVSGYYEVSVIR